MTHDQGGNRNTKPTLLAMIGGLLVKGIGAWRRQANSVMPDATKAAAKPARKNGALAEAIRTRADGAHVEGGGVVIRLLPDDNDGARHQRILVEVPGGGTVLIAHNIDVAPRLAMHSGDEIAFKGVYVWNDRGGVIHWTHHDPAGFHTNGWVRANRVVSE